MNVGAAVCLVLLCGLSAVAAGVPLSAIESAGKRLYREGLSSSGEPIMARVGAADISVPATALPCAGCHGTDGLGRPEGGIRPADLSWRRLAGAHGQQRINGRDYPAYNDATLARAVQEGRDPANNRLDPSMPRFVLTLNDQRNLTAYLKRLQDEQDPGLEPDRLRLGTLLPTRGPLAEEGATVAAILTGSIARINQAGGIHGRQLQLIVADPGPDRASARQALAQLIDQPVFALVAPLAPALDEDLSAQLEQAGVPLIGALSLLGASQTSRQIFEPLPGLREQWVALADYAQQGLQLSQGPTLVAWYGDAHQQQAAAAFADYLQGQGWLQVRALAFDPRQPQGFTGQAASARAVFYVGEGAGFGPLAGHLQEAGVQPYLFAASSQVAGDVLQLPSGFSRRVFLAYPFIPSDWTPSGRAALTQLRQRQGLNGQHAVLQVAAYSSMLLLCEGLKQAGRDASREKLISALEGLHDFVTGVTPPISFGPGKRLGLNGAHIVTVELPEQRFYPVAPYQSLQARP
ncbi:MAG: ABC transporter substrate-binding protein [Pseudomonas sp.]|uniref:cytochrome c/ABC transporter substrate-binding protein n=1 Tax=Pseudomonas abieticivorans TaxID=2931382 RepID=UPI0020BD7757|nr:ABC transporter substrate-binding protein [Pseudomonas sp. PIA16]MDE1164583.1 ABC transporter substrate-binding protein [Pseudomonas sp.]